MAEFTGVRTSAQSDSSNENRQVRLVHERIFLYSPQYTPILMLKGGIMPGPQGERIKVKGLIPSKFAPAKKVEWFDKDLPSVKAFAEGTITDGVDTTITLDDGAGAALNSVRAGAVLKAEDEIIWVSAYNTSTRIATVVRGVGATTGVAHDDNTPVYVLSNGIEENSTFQKRFGALAVQQENFMQIFRHDWSVSRSADRIRLYGGKDKAETMAEAAVEHVREIERQITFGFKANTGLTLNSLNVQVMGGLVEFNDGVFDATTNTGRFLTTFSAHGGTVDYGEFVETFLVESFKFSSPRRRKIFIAGSVFGKIFGRFSTNVGNIQTYVRDTAFGVNVTEVISPAGTIEFLTSGAIEEVEAGRGFCFDPEFLEFDYVDNTFMVDNAQPKGTDGHAGFFLTEATMKFEAIKTITSIKGVTGWVAES